ncbi:MAG: hypothetical protein QM571_03650 [Micrococcaceae bacterium]
MFGKILTHFSRLAWQWQVTLICGVARLVSVLIMLVTASFQPVNPWTEPHPGYFHYTQFWDSQWYQTIYDTGYPNKLPENEIGIVEQSPWAFYPLFPAIVKLLNKVTTVEWLYLAPLTATLLGFLATLVIYKLFRTVATHRQTLWAIALIAFLPVAPILQVPYAESLQLFLLAVCLYYLKEQKYPQLFLAIPLLCLARPIGAPWAALMAFYTLYRWFITKDFKSKGELYQNIALTAYSGVWALLWTFLAGYVTGVPDAYTKTEMSWRGGGQLILFEPWFKIGIYMLGPIGVIAPIIIFGLFFWALYSKSCRQLGIEMQLWCAAYGLYLFAVFEPQTSTFRMLIPLFPMLLALVMRVKSKAILVAILGISFLLQILWLGELWNFVPLPQGGDWPP